MTRWLATAALLAALSGPALAQTNRFGADDHISNTSTIVANNTTPIVISANPATVYTVEAFNNGTTLAYIKLYNSTTALCGQTSPAPLWRGMIPFGQSSSGGGFGLPNINGDAYPTGVTMCVTTGIADSDTGSPAASTYIVNIHWKRLQ